ncbi:hypothetical protein Fmac_010186 [Flemingia macrophylla]|uniref:Pre-mRNA 3'-end-processing endonuclease polyadenylation factor C-term domain-containing protein n=1 Tax=Flemingia macrophylla TaxID=520843 RepID=A0ABD1N2D7_9FABA
MKRLKQKFMIQFVDRNTKVFTLENCQSVEMYFNSQKIAKVRGKLAEKTPKVGEIVDGFVRKMDANAQEVDSRVGPERIITGRHGKHDERQRHTIQERKDKIYESVEESMDEESRVPTLQLHECVTVKHESKKHVSLHWSSSATSDMVPDSIVSLILNSNRNVPNIVDEVDAIKMEEEHKKKSERIVHALLVSLFGDVKVGENGKMIINVDGNVTVLDKESGEIESENEDLKERVRTAFRRIQKSVNSIPPPADF